MEYDNIFQHIGESGFYQIGILSLLGLLSLFAGLNSITSNFYAYPQQHWCHVRRLENYPHGWQKYVAIPNVDGSDSCYKSCSMYDLDYDSMSDDVIRKWNRSLMITEDTPTRECSAWVFDQSEFVSTILSEVHVTRMTNSCQYFCHLASTNAKPLQKAVHEWYVIAPLSLIAV